MLWTNKKKRFSMTRQLIRNEKRKEEKLHNKFYLHIKHNSKFYKRKKRRKNFYIKTKIIK